MLAVVVSLLVVDLRSERKEIVRWRSAELVLDQGTFKSYNIFFTKGSRIAPARSCRVVEMVT